VKLCSLVYAAAVNCVLFSVQWHDHDIKLTEKVQRRLKRLGSLSYDARLKSLNPERFELRSWASLNGTLLHYYF